MQRPDQSVYAQQLEEHRLKQQREAEMGHEDEPQVRQEPAPRVEEAGPRRSAARGSPAHGSTES